MLFKLHYYFLFLTQDKVPGVSKIIEENHRYEQLE